MAPNPSYGRDSSGIDIAQAHASSIKGKTALITGVSRSGIGEAVAKAFANAGAAMIIITGRNDEKLAAAYNDLSITYPNTKFRPLKLDLNSLAGAKSSAQEILDDASIKQIDITVANAGFSSQKEHREVTSDGIESHFGSNHLGHFVFANTLLPKIKAAAKVNKPGATRIVIVSSGAANLSPIRFSDWNYEKHSNDVPESEQGIWAAHPVFDLPPNPVPFSYLTAYAQSKTANVLMAVQLNKLLASEGIASYSLNPGPTESAALKVMVTPSIRPKLEAALGPIKSLDAGAAVVVVAALDPGLKPEEGVWLDDCQLGEIAPWSTDREAAEKLWQLSEQIVADKLG